MSVTLSRAKAGAFVLLAAIVLAMSCAASAFAERRVALVIGNADYRQEARLQNPLNDADDVAAALSRLQFDVDKHHDLTFAGMRRALREFSRKAAGADMAVVFFAGHGMEVGGRNYLIPTDAQLATDLDLSYEAFEIEKVMDAVARANGVKLVILDACRNNPFAQAMELTSPSRSIGRGFKRVEPEGGGMLIAYSAAAGTTADDGNGRNSPYTQALLEHIEEPGVEIRILFGKVRDSVLQHTGRQQRPAEYGSLPGTAIFLSAPQSPTPTPVPMVRTPAPSVSVETVVAAWSMVEKSDDVGLLQAFRKQFGERNAFYDALAMRRIEALSKDEEKSAEKAEGMAARDTCDRLVASPVDKGARAPGRNYAEFEQDIGEALLACWRAAKAFPNDLTTRYQLGRTYHAKKDYSAALQEYRVAAAGGYAAAMTNIGALYAAGLGVEKDDAEAVKWYRVAAALGNAQAQFNFGVAYANGQGLRRDDAQAVIWYRKAAEQRHPYAQFHLGWMYEQGHGVEKSESEAVRWYRLAAEQGVSGSQSNLGTMYREGRGVGRNYAEAVKWYRKAAAQGDSDAQVNLGYMYRKGLGVEQSNAEGAKWYRKSADQGNMFGQANLASMYEQGFGVAKDIDKAVELYRKAAAQGNEAAKESLARLGKT